jgi:two-component system, cell cycle sensor histidine kinase and response regulator CckA
VWLRDCYPNGVASPTHLRLEWKERAKVASAPQISLDTLPLPAAVLDITGLLISFNQEWATLGTELHRQETVRAGLKAIAEGVERVSQQVEERGSIYRLIITRLPSTAGWALAVLQRPEAPPQIPKMAESEKMANVGRLLGGVVHDFANLLTLISGYSEILLNRVGQDHFVRDELDEIRKAALRGARLTSQLLGFARGRRAQLALVDVNETVWGMVRMLRPIIGEHLDVRTLCAPDLGKTMADAGEMEQVLMNLVLNARDAMPQGGKITIKTCNTEIGKADAEAHGIAPGNYVMLAVSDTGHGIEPATLDRVWEPFFTTKPEGNGTGLGLNTVRKVIREYRGAVWVESTVGEGATFYVCLPRVAVPQTAAVRAESQRLPALVPPISKSGSETVLIVEDEEGVRRLLRYVLESRGYNVLEAADGEQALRVYRESDGGIQLVLTDMIMPRMGGRELAARLSEMVPDLKIVFMSGYTDDVLLRTGELRRGMSFLQKPLRPETLAAKVREALDSPTRPFGPA